MALWCVTQRSDGNSKPTFLLHALLARQINTHMVLSTSFSVFCTKLDVNFSMPIDLQHYYCEILTIRASTLFFLLHAQCQPLHWVESFLRSVLVLSQPQNSLHFLEPEGSLPLSHEPATCTYLELNQSSPCSPSHFLNNHFNCVLLPTYRCSKLSLSLRSPHRNPVAPLLFPIHSKWFGLFWFGLFVHPFSHICNIRHVNYRLQFTTHLVMYRHLHNTIY